MRIISGKFRGKNIVAPPNLPVRPTTDFAKTGLFNILNNKIDYDTVKLLDLFSGTGCISYEFNSRGCNNILAVDADIKCIKFINQTFGQLDAIGCETFKSDVFVFLKNCAETFDVIFADPPFDLPIIERIPQLITERNLLNKNGILVLEHASDRVVDFNGMTKETRKYGNVSFSFYTQV